MGHISLEKYAQGWIFILIIGIKALGLENYNEKPAGFDTDKIILDTFVMEA